MLLLSPIISYIQLTSGSIHVGVILFAILVPVRVWQTIFITLAYFLFWITISVVNLHTNKVARVLGKIENIRFLHLVLLQGKK